MKRIYIAGPMRGYPDHNFPAFYKAAAHFRSLGWEVINPAEIDRKQALHDLDCVITSAMCRAHCLRDIAALSLCDAIVLLPLWEESKGAKTEYHAAKWMGLEIIFMGGQETK